MEAENESGSDQENYSRLVSSVIHEYDIIDVEPGARSEESANEDVKSRDSSQDDVTLPRVNCPEKIVRMSCIDRIRPIPLTQFTLHLNLTMLKEILGY